jgi:hypothetical protein
MEKTPRVMKKLRNSSGDSSRCAKDFNHIQRWQATLWHQNPSRQRVPLAGGAQGSGAPRANQNARKHGLFISDAIAGRRQIQVLLGEARRLLGQMK